jgi:hypothetical protein
MKTDFKKQIPEYTAKPGEFAVVCVPALQFLMVDGHGDPNSAQEYKDALAALYPLAYALKFLSKTDLGQDYTVMPLEALWWSDDMAYFTNARDKSRWDWTLMTMVPDWLGAEHMDSAQETLTRRRGGAVVKDVRLESFHEGLSVQTLHIGPYDHEGPVLEEMHNSFIPGKSLIMTGRHHEIYLSDPRRAAPGKLRTILRQPVSASEDGNVSPQ